MLAKDNLAFNADLEKREAAEGKGTTTITKQKQVELF